MWIIFGTSCRNIILGYFLKYLPYLFLLQVASIAKNIVSTAQVGSIMWIRGCCNTEKEIFFVKLLNVNCVNQGIAAQFVEKILFRLSCCKCVKNFVILLC